MPAQLLSLARVVKVDGRQRVTVFMQLGLVENGAQKFAKLGRFIKSVQRRESGRS